MAFVGRGQYYKNKYGGGRGRGRGGGGSQPYQTAQSQTFQAGPTAGGQDWQRLQNDLKRINGRQYGRSCET